MTTLPLDFLAQLQTLGLSSEEQTAFVAALDEKPRVSLRRNSQKPCQIPYQHLSPIPWHPQGYWLEEQRPNFALHPQWHAGAFYVQEASSMFVHHALQSIQTQDTDFQLHLALDLCAAPGGKTSILLENLPPQGIVVANEVIKSRCQILAENLQKWGDARLIISNNDPQDFRHFPHTFDLVLADVPCSGEGLFRKQADSRQEWSLEQVQHCALRARRILGEIWPSIKPGGYLIFSTCTYNREENEGSLHWLQAQTQANLQSLRLPLHPDWKICEEQSEKGFWTYRFLPHQSQGEGFFLCVLRKPAEDLSPSKPHKAKLAGHWTALAPKQTQPLSHTVKDYAEQSFMIHPKTGDWHLLPGDLLSQAAKLSSLRLIQVGCPWGQFSGKDWRWHPFAALSLSLEAENIAQINLDWDQALAYLRLQLPQLPEQAAKGWCRVCYEGLGLGWAKNLGNRFNNHFPKEWRLRTGL